MSSYREIRDLKRDTSISRVAIREVNMAEGYIRADDAYGGNIQISVDFHDPLLAVPAIGEMWLATRTGNTWSLGKRLESGVEQQLASELSPGDRRLEAPNNLVLAGKDVIIKGTTFINGIQAATQENLESYVLLTDTRLTDQRVPLDNSVTNSKIISGAGISISKLEGYPADSNKILRGDATWGILGDWSPIAATLTFSVADAPIFVCTTSTDLTSIITVGAKLKLTHSATTKYFIVHAISSGSITLYGGTDYTLAATAISNPSFSHLRSPIGFPMTPVKWTIESFGASGSASGAAGWHTIISPFSVPIGVWNLYYDTAVVGSQSAPGNTAAYVLTTLSTTTDTETDTHWTAYWELGYTTGNLYYFSPQVNKSGIFTATVKTPVYFNVRTSLTGSGTQVQLRGSPPAIFRATSVYL